MERQVRPHAATTTKPLQPFFTQQQQQQFDLQQQKALVAQQQKLATQLHPLTGQPLSTGSMHASQQQAAMLSRMQQLNAMQQQQGGNNSNYQALSQQQQQQQQHQLRLLNSMAYNKKQPFVGMEFVRGGGGISGPLPTPQNYQNFPNHQRGNAHYNNNPGLGGGGYGNAMNNQNHHSNNNHRHHNNHWNHQHNEHHHQYHHDRRNNFDGNNIRGRHDGNNSIGYDYRGGNRNNNDYNNSRGGSNEYGGNGARDRVRRDSEVEWEEWERKRELDEYAGLMTPKQKSWLRNIQTVQLATESPYTDDYYYVVSDFDFVFVWLIF